MVMEALWPHQTAGLTAWRARLLQHVSDLWDQAVVDAMYIHHQLPRNGPPHDIIVLAFHSIIYAVVGLFRYEGANQYVAECMAMDMILVLDITPSGDGSKLIHTFIDALKKLRHHSALKAITSITDMYVKITSHPEWKDTILKRKDLHINMILSESKRRCRDTRHHSIVSP